MDAPACDPAALWRAFAVITLWNRWSGGDRLLFRQVERIVGTGAPGPLRLLDVGAGAGHASVRLARRLGRGGRRPHLVLADLHEAALEIARNRARRNPFLVRGVERLDYVRLTGPRLPFGDRSFDVAFSSTTLHHMERPQAVAFLREMARVSRLGWVVADLRRSRTAYVGVRLLAALLPRDALPRRDGPVSVRRAFTPREVEELCVDAGIRPATVSSRLFRLAIRGTP
ncbi:MAG: methyltransferase domain-containing protein [Gemmatimonadota bacterium]